MYRILFVCYGNICRSPMAEFIMKDLVQKRGLAGSFHIQSRGTSTEELGNPVYPPARAELQKHGISCAGKVSIQLQKADYDAFDLLIVMDERNVRASQRITGGNPQGKVRMMMELTARPGEVADPWYTRQYDVAYRDILEGCEAWLDALLGEKTPY
ncbi:MAG TPA: low molecular weight protein-tyrosine-phosphatase [Candidatus Limiplasma sp.]|nr:low molecular weight protein-tyrosine-phosphatase [Candidatus Limiplasma sp.]HRX07803.1 low molecular weight protein-tyrosine-phosphatase [Candidatus Limiplasma sp.]